MTSTAFTKFNNVVPTGFRSATGNGALSKNDIAEMLSVYDLVHGFGLVAPVALMWSARLQMLTRESLSLQGV